MGVSVRPRSWDPGFHGWELSLAGTQICRGFKVHDLITCESKVQVFCFPREIVMARDMFSSNRESNFELRGITKPFEFRPVISFRKESSSVGAELGVAVNARDGIAVTDQKNH